MNSVRDVMLPVSEGELVAGRYRVDALLGTGTTGVVARAEDLDARESSFAGARASRPDAAPRFVALKLLWPHLAATEEGLASFHREQEIAERLSGDHTPRVLDAGVHVRLGSAAVGPTSARGVPFFVMELVMGSDLAEVLRARREAGSVGLAADEVVEIALQVAEGLAEAHAQGVVHRDVKPANLLLAERPDGRPLVKILDFGMSKGASREGALPLGSPAYAAPERVADPTSADPRSDIWSLGVVMYELLSGRLPFTADGVAGLLVAIMTRDAEPLPVEAGELTEIVHRCLARDPAARYEDVAALADALAPLGRPDAPARAAAARRRLEARETPVPPPAWPTHGRPRPSQTDEAVVQTTSLAPVAVDAPASDDDAVRAFRPRGARRAALALAGTAAALVGFVYAADLSIGDLGARARVTAPPAAATLASPPPAVEVDPPPPAPPSTASAVSLSPGSEEIPSKNTASATKAHRPPASAVPIARPRAPSGAKAPPRAQESDDLRQFLDRRK